MKWLFDRGAESRVFSSGGRALALLPMQGSPFKAKYSGPHSIVCQVTEQDYLVTTPDRKKSLQLCHINMLKPYYFQCFKSELSDGEGVLAALAAGAVPFVSFQVVAGDD